MGSVKWRTSSDVYREMHQSSNFPQCICAPINEDYDDYDEEEEEEDESMGAAARGPGLYEFLIEAELQHYYSGLKNDLKVNTVAQIKYVEDDDLMQIGMTKPETRRLKKFFHKYYPQTYLRRIKQMILPKKEDGVRSSVVISDGVQDKNMVKVPSKHIIAADNISVHKELGIGEFGVVQQGVWTNEDGERIQVAIKKLSKERMQNNPMEFLKEAAIMHTIDHEHIVRLYGVVLETNALMLVTELAPLRSLLECLKEPALRPSFPVISLCDFALQICDGMQYLESKRLIHRDLAARNILVFSKNKIKISDFGLSRALGVGKDYYQTNFNVNLKLPIAWCAPECINYLRFTSASDVWAYGVTLWEMFSYGFQPWAALTGQQILEAIDEPNFQRLEQPDCCPKEYYILMLKCWQHDPNKRPNFADILTMLPECKPEQVQAIKDHIENTSSPKSKRDQLQYKVGDVLTVLDKKPLADQVNIWKGALNGGKTGLFNPAHTVAYLGTNIPSMKPAFSRAEGKSSVYSSKRKLRPEMISRPQADFRHTGHVGLDGAFFGDISCLGDKYHLLPKQVVAPYKPQEDGEQRATLTRASSDVSDRAPLLLKSGEVGKSGPASENWSDNGSEKLPPEDLTLPKNLVDHEYHEISDDEDNHVESPRFDTFFQRCLDFGPSLMDEVFKALGTKHEELDEARDEANNVKNEIRENVAPKPKEGTVGKKKQAAVKPISASDQRTLESAIAMANEMASKSMLDLDRSESDTAQDSPHTPSSPTKRKFSFRLPTSRNSPKNERRNFAEEAASIPDIQEMLTEEAKEAYNTLVDKGQVEASCPPPLPSQPPQVVEEETNPLRMLRSGMPVRPKVRGNKHGGLGRAMPQESHSQSMRRNSESRISDSRSQGPIPALSTTSLSSSTSFTAGSQSMSMENMRVPPPVCPKPNQSTVSRPGRSVHPQSPPPAPPVNSSSNESASVPHENGNVTVSQDDSENVEAGQHNPLPLPPRDRTKPIQQHKPRQRKHPLIIPGATTRPLVKPSLSMPDVSPAISSETNTVFYWRMYVGTNENGCRVAEKISHMHTNGRPERLLSETGSASSENLSPVASPTTATTTTTTTTTTNCNQVPEISESTDGSIPNNPCNTRVSPAPPAKPPRSHDNNHDDSFDNQIQADMDSLDDIPEEEAPVPPVDHHVSCEDLLDFACDRPNAKRTQGRARGMDSDEVRIMQKVLANDIPARVVMKKPLLISVVGGEVAFIDVPNMDITVVTAEECLVTLNETDWDVHKAIKYVKLQTLLRTQLVSVANCKQTLVSCNWDVQKAYSYLLATYGVTEDSTEV